MAQNMEFVGIVWKTNTTLQKGETRMSEFLHLTKPSVDPSFKDEWVFISDTILKKILSNWSKDEN